MLKYFDDLKTICRQLKNRSISMQRRLMIYFLSIIAVIILVLLVICTATDMLNFSEQQVNQGLSMALDNSASKITRQLDHINAHGIKLSNQISKPVITPYRGCANHQFYELVETPPNFV